jgi:hypothetical protein
MILIDDRIKNSRLARDIACMKFVVPIYIHM